MSKDLISRMEDPKRFDSRTSKYIVNLIAAEERYLLSAAWRLVDVDGHMSMWRHPRYTQIYTRNHAVLIAKAEDPNIGIH